MGRGEGRQEGGGFSIVIKLTYFLPTSSPVTLCPSTMVNEPIPK